MDLNVALVGIGSIGGIIAYQLLDSNKSITMITNNEKLTKQISQNGIILNDNVSYLNHGSRVESELHYDNFDVILLAMRANQVKNACSNLVDHLGPDGFFVSLQNGMTEEEIIEIAGKNRVVPGIVAFGGKMIGLGKYTQTTFGKIYIGEFNGNFSSRVVKLKNYIEGSLEVEITDNIQGVLWSKLAINSSLNGMNAILGGYIGDMFKNTLSRNILFELYRETLDLASLVGVKVAQLAVDPAIFYFNPNLSIFQKVKKLTLSFLLWKRYRRSKASTLQSIEKNRETEIEYINGYIINLAKKHQMNLPYNKTVYLLVKRIEASELDVGYANLSCFKKLLH